jgi:bifunctional N-acetylglucosamine-1-phosphate-uridyltransferase/glucosamine-1-phosphate-acetyltransferase GlmU-like protein
MSNLNGPTAIILDDFESDLPATELRELGKLGWLFGGKPLVNHILEELAQIGVQTCFILTKQNAKQLSDSIMNVFRWDNRMQIEILDYDLNKEAVLQNFGALANPNGMLIVEGNKIRGRLIQQFLDAAQNIEADCIEAQSNNQSLGLTVLNPNASTIPTLGKVELENAIYQPLQTCSDFSTANFTLLKGGFPGLYPRLAPIAGLPLWQHNRATLHRNTEFEKDLFIERGGHVDRSCHLNQVLINRDAYISRGVELENVVLMPNAFVSPKKTISNAIVSGEQKIKLDRLF